MLKYIVLDNEFNNKWYKNLIGKEFDSDKIPSYAIVKLVEEKNNEY